MTFDEPAAEQVSELLTHEHRQIDDGIEEFAARLGEGQLHPEPLVAAMAALRRHIYLEEEFLFPPLRAAGLMMPIQVMLHEHGHIWQAMDGIDEALADPAARAAATDGLAARCRELLALLDQHNSKEEPIVYPRAAVDLSPEERAELGGLLARGRTPDGWICQILQARSG